MQLVLKGKNFIISDRIREYVEKKISKFDRYLPDIDETRVEITEEKTKSAKDSKVVQITLRANGTILRAEERGEAIYACIDAVAEKMHRQIVRYKGKRINRWQGQTNKRRNDYSVMPELDPEVLDALAEEGERKIVRTKRFTAHPMNQDEAVEQMELLGHDFFVFYNAELGRINVLYRRADNNYGLLDPELV
jgi:putative sigma-54 modulation protein